MNALKSKKGFTIVELLIVIVIIGILAGLVLLVFAGGQQKARNATRQTDINALNTEVVKFNAEYGFYPTAADLNNQTFRSTFMKGFNKKALSDPRQAGDTGDISASNVDAGTFQYSYVTAGDTPGSTCDTSTTITTPEGEDPVPSQTNQCTTYVLKANLEGAGNKTFVKDSGE